jgi:hypothetical protein
VEPERIAVQAPEEVSALEADVSLDSAEGFSGRAYALNDEVPKPPSPQPTPQS